MAAPHPAVVDGLWLRFWPPPAELDPPEADDTSARVPGLVDETN